jgi:acyl carrier protein
MPNDPQSSAVEALIPEVSALIVEALNLDVAPADIDPDVSLFGEGLDLDSIDVLELALVVSKRYGFKMQADDPNNEKIFSSLRALTAHIANQRTV